MIFKFIRKEHISDIMELSNELVHIYLPLLIPRSNVDTLTTLHMSIPTLVWYIGENAWYQ